MCDVPALALLLLPFLEAVPEEPPALSLAAQLRGLTPEMWTQPTSLEKRIFDLIPVRKQQRAVLPQDYQKTADKVVKKVLWTSPLKFFHHLG